MTQSQFFTQCSDDLLAVTTITEAAKLWDVPRAKLYRLCREGKIIAMRFNNTGTWLLSKRCLTEMYGPPQLRLPWD